MLEAFPEEIEPRAIILFDINPEVVAEGQRLIQGFRETPADAAISLPAWEHIFTANYNAYPENAMKKYARLLHQLAQKGNLVIAQADFNNPELIQEIARLPGFRESNNVVYLSNIADHIWRGNVTGNTSFVPDFSFLDSLNPNAPNRNYYIDTLTTALNYRLRISTQPPEFKAHDFTPSLIGLQTEPIDKIDDPPEDIIWQDITKWSTDQLFRAYNSLESNPLRVERKKYIEGEIDRQRKNEVSNYPSLKERAAKPSEKSASGLETRVSVPENPDEEEKLLTELTKPYDYERYFIPYVAQNYWRNAETPAEINLYQVPKREDFVYEPNTYRLLYRKEDPRNWVIGKVERWMTSGRGITYEDLTLAKLYREIERRVLQRRSGAITHGKTFYELSKEVVPPN